MVKEKKEKQQKQTIKQNKPENKPESKNKKKTPWFYLTILLIIVILALGVFAYTHYDKNFKAKQERKAAVVNYKQAIYASVLCEYNCPLKTQMYNKSLDLLPDVNCVNNCTLVLMPLLPDVRSFNISKEDLNKDEFITSIEKLVNTCKISNTKLINSTYRVDNANFFPCVQKAMPTIGEKYDYLKNSK
jgi:hypothetical protein